MTLQDRPGALFKVMRLFDQHNVNIIEKALTVYFDLLDLKLAQKRLKDLDEGRDRIRSAEEFGYSIGF